MLDKQQANSIAHSGSIAQQRAQQGCNEMQALLLVALCRMQPPPPSTHMSHVLFGTESLFNQSSFVG